ncbi:MAG TPA: hypothetical protein VFU00_01840 [Gemmatimonadales bacterium]|nr:hypothetical protein [Gemmatimonadales bacterium]
MRMLVVIYGGPRPGLVPGIFDRLGVTGWTQLAEGHGAGRTGRREGTRAWPGESQVYFSVADATVIDAVTAALRDEAAAAQSGERLHVAQLPVESFF